MVKPSCVKGTDGDDFNLRLSEGETNHSEMSRRCLSYSPTHGNSRDVADSDSALDSLDPSKRELLEARLFGFGKSPSTHNQDSQSNASFSSVNSDKEEGHENNADRSHRRKRKADETPPFSHNKSGRAEVGGKITEYFTKADSSPQQNNKVSSRPFQFNVDSGSTLPCPVMTTPTSSRHSNASEHGSSSLRHARLMNNNSAHSVEPICIHEACQTDVTLKDYEELEKKASDHASSQLKDNTIERMKEVINDLKQQRENLEESNTKLEKNLEKCQNMNKELLIENSVRLKKAVREECMNNRLRLGQFVPVRQGAHFVDTWVDGFAFTELIKLQESITQRREELEKQKKYLMKRKPVTGTAKEKKTNKSSSDTLDIIPLPPMDYYEQEEILKLRAMSLKKEELELQIELEKLEKQRNLHIRELKRIHSEDSSSFKDHPVLNDRYLLLHLLGKGGFSEVYKGFDLKEQRYIACKIHQLNKDWKEDKKANYIKHALREYNIHRSLKHPRIVSLYDVFEIDANSFCTVLEYCDGNDLDFLLKQHKTIPEREARSIVMQVVRALKYLNEIKPPVIHYDLKPGNILLAGSSLSGEVKITDFGLSKIIDNDDDSLELTSQGAGTYWYLPPECFVVGREPPKISSKVDVWSVGVIFFQMLYGKKPFGHNLSQTAILEQNTILKAKEVEFPSKPQSSNEAKHFIRRCLAYRKDDRADVIALCEDPYLRPSTSSKKSSTSTTNDTNS